MNVLVEVEQGSFAGSHLSSEQEKTSLSGLYSLIAPVFSDGLICSQ